MNRYRQYSNEWLLSSKSYGEHVSAMTSEHLESKSDIAAELAWRDDRISELEQEVARLTSLMEQDGWEVDE